MNIAYNGAAFEVDFISSVATKNYKIANTISVLEILKSKCAQKLFQKVREVQKFQKF